MGVHQINKFYIYTHTRNDTGEVFYVGKGFGSRAKEKHKRSKAWNRIVAKAGYTIDYLYKNLSEQMALTLEGSVIARIGRRDLGLGPLVNFTDGGEGTAGHIHSQEARDKIGAAHKGNTYGTGGKGLKRSPETCKRISEGKKGRIVTDEMKEKYRQATTKIMTPEMRERLSVTRKNLWSDPEYRGAQIQSQQNRPPVTEETKAKQSAGIKADWDSRDPELKLAIRKKISESNKGKKRTPEMVEKNRLNSLKMWADPAYREKRAMAHNAKKGEANGSNNGNHNAS